MILPQDYDTKFHKKPRLVLEDFSLLCSLYYFHCHVYFFTFFVVFAMREALHIPILCYAINWNESMLLFCVYLHTVVESDTQLLPTQL